MGTSDVAVPQGCSQQQAATRRLAVAWQDRETRKMWPVGILGYNGQYYSFRYVQNITNIDNFRPLLGFPNLQRTYQSVRLFPLFAQRVMDPRRPDHERYVKRLGLRVDATPWEQMSRSGGAREGDVLQLFPEPIVHEDGRITCKFLVHGIRHMSSGTHVLDGQEISVDHKDIEDRLSSLRQGQNLRLVREPTNPVNSQAIVITMEDGFPLGWVPDLLLSDFREMTHDDPGNANVTVDHVNGADTPSHLRLLVRLQTKPNPTYRPFTGPGWEPLSPP
jgi:hypothetical protein